MSEVFVGSAGTVEWYHTVMKNIERYGELQETSIIKAFQHYQERAMTM